MKAIKITQLVAAILGILFSISEASNGIASSSTLFLATVSSLVLIRTQIEINRL